MLRLLITLVVNVWVSLLSPFWLWRRLRAAGASGWLELEVEGASAEFAPPARLGDWLRPSHGPTLHEGRAALEAAAKDRRVAGLVVRLTASPGGAASLQSWRALLTRFRDSGKPVTVFLPEGAGTREYFLATAANRIVLGPDTRVAPFGFVAETPYLKSALDRAGIGVEVFARGDFKTAGEPLVRDTMSEPQRAQVSELLDHNFDAFVNALVDGRGVTSDRAEQWVTQGPFTPRQAREQGLVDALAYDDQLNALLEPAAVDGQTLVSLRRYARRRKLPFRRFRRAGYLAVVPVHGVIVSEAPPWSRVADERSFSQAMKTAREDHRALGVLLHIDSRGGSALASARMLHEVHRCAAKKPVVAYFSDVAASGGYMIGVGAHEIVAQPLSVTGSIGVVAARLVLEDLTQRLGVHVERVQRGGRVDMFSPFRFMSSDAKEAFEGELEDVYRRFVEQVADGRRLSVSEVEPLAAGRVWAGIEAQRAGLVDHLGDATAALERLRLRIGTPAARRAEPRLLVARGRPRLTAALRPSVAELDWLRRWVGDPGLELAALCQRPGSDAVLAWEPSAVAWQR